jgi:hypothetical protein
MEGRRDWSKLLSFAVFFVVKIAHLGARGGTVTQHRRPPRRRSYQSPNGVGAPRPALSCLTVGLREPTGGHGSRPW